MNVYSFHDVTPCELSLIDLVYQFLAESAKKHGDYDHGVPIPFLFGFSLSRSMRRAARIAKIFRSNGPHHALSDDRSIDTINRATIHVSLARDFAQLPGDFVLFLDIGSIWSEPTTRTENDRRIPQRNLRPPPSWQTASGENDIYAGMLHKGTIADQKLPDYVIDASGRATDFRVRPPSLGMESPCFLVAFG